ncbi:ParB/RepB/Spo0J family partition protein [Halococcus sp. IIIV-5B]|uniref:ParB/RepB/Spo0J family partition protein n=1 Tax=Halococcus sp. IIIV-5B TaxID=2321230 RepID=UPI0011C3AAC1|nr:ParB/RepB/Spo0J family partition protein [Halococcus sp. IIIV-5B]
MAVIPTTVLDGHHRLQAAKELGFDEISIKRYSDLSDAEKEDWQFTENTHRRNMGESRKRDLIEERFLILDGRGEHQTDSEIAEFLGVGETWVRDTRHSLNSKNRIGAEFRDNSSKRDDVRQAIEDDPDASNVTIAERTDVSDPTVGKVRSEMEQESDIPSEQK